MYTGENVQQILQITLSYTYKHYTVKLLMTFFLLVGVSENRAIL
jgi:hypothetical protein